MDEADKTIRNTKINSEAPASYISQKKKVNYKIMNRTKIKSI
jgi:hypothetical protein